MVWVLRCIYDEVTTYIHNVCLVAEIIKVLLDIYEVVYSFYVFDRSKWYVGGIFMSLLSMYEVMRLHMYIALVGFHWDYE